MSDHGLRVIAELETILLEEEEMDWYRRLARLNKEAYVVERHVKEIEVRFMNLASGITQMGSALVHLFPASMRPLAQAAISTVHTVITAAQTIAASSSAMGPIGWLQAGMAAASIAVAVYGLAVAVATQGQVDEELNKFTSQMNQMTSALSQIMSSFR